MTKEELESLLEPEVRRWASRPIEKIIAELGDKGLSYDRDAPIGWHQFSVMLLENTSDYIHVLASADDGSKEWACSPLSWSFLMYRDGRIDI